MLKSQPHQTRPLPFAQGHLGNQALPEGLTMSTLEQTTHTQKRERKTNNEKRPKHADLRTSTNQRKNE